MMINSRSIHFFLTLAFCTVLSTVHAQWQSLPTTPTRTVAHLKGSKDFTLVIENDEKLLMSTNAGDTWKDITGTLSAGFRIPQVVINESSLVGFDYLSSSMLRYSIADGTWENISQGLPSNGYFKNVVATPNRIMVLHLSFSNGNSSKVYVSDNSGSSWSISSEGLSPHFQPAILEPMKNVSEVLLFGTQEGKQAVYSSVDEGDSWQLKSILTLPCEIGNVVTDGAHTVLAMTNCGGVYVSSNRGANWQTNIDLPENISVISLVRIGKNIFINGSYPSDGAFQKKISVRKTVG